MRGRETVDFSVKSPSLPLSLPLSFIPSFFPIPSVHSQYKDQARMWELGMEEICSSEIEKNKIIVIDEEQGSSIFLLL